MNRIETTAGPLYQAASLATIPWLVHGFGTRGIVLDNYLSHFGVKDAASVCTNQIHGNRVHILNETPSDSLLVGDAFVTKGRGVVCFIRTADCVPILLCDPEHKAVGAIHAGWRGHVCDVVGATIRTMKDKFGTRADNLLVAVGPSICARCYTVGEEVIDSFREKGFADNLWVEKSDNFFSLNLGKASEGLLISSGVKRENINLLPLCTSCHNGDFASYRREHSDISRQVNFILIR